MSTIENLRALEAAATKGPWMWSAATGDVQLEGSTEYPEMSPILVARGCGNKHATARGVEGCMPEKLKDDLRACPLHPTASDRDLIAALRNAAPKLLAVAEAISEAVKERDYQLSIADHDAPGNEARSRKREWEATLRAYEAIRALEPPDAR